MKRNYIYQALWQLLLIVVPLVTTPYLSRVLGSTQIGLYSYTYAIANYFVMFATLGMSTYGVREIASCRDSRELRSQMFADLFASQLIVGVCVIAIYAIYTLLCHAGGLLLSLIWGIWVFSCIFDVSWLFFGIEDFRRPTIRSCFAKIISLIIIFLFVKSSDDLWIYCLAVALSFAINIIALWPFVPLAVDFVPPVKSNLLGHTLQSARLFIPVIAISVYVSLDKILLGNISGMNQVGLFEYSEKLSKMPMALITAMGTVMLPRMTKELDRGNRKSAYRLLDNSIWAMMSVAFALMFGIIAIAPEFSPIFLGREFGDCSGVMRILSLIIPIISMSNVLGRQYLVPLHRDIIYTISVCIGASVNIIINIILLPDLGASGAAVATVGAELSVLFVQAASVRKELSFKKYVKYCTPFLTIGLIMMICIRASSVVLISVWGMTYITLVSEVALGILIYSALFAVYCLYSKEKHFLYFFSNKIYKNRRSVM